MVFIPEIEQKSLEQQAHFQIQKLKETLAYLQENSPFYKRHLNGFHTQINQLTSLADLQHLPVTTKEDLQQFNNDFLCVPKQLVAEYMATSGTLGKPVTIALTHNDLERLAYNEFLSFHLMELNADDVVQLMLTLDRQFMAGTAYYSGLRKIGASIIRSGPGLPQLQWDTLQQYDATTLIAVPSFLSKMMEMHPQSPLRHSSVKKILAIGESLRDEALQPNSLARKIISQWNGTLYSTYASTEMQTAFTECSAGQGGHHHPELIIVEILDDAGHQLPYGEAGEVTITNLGIEGMPLLRYRTGDICKAYAEPCSCGRTTLRLGAVLGRKKQMIKFKGTSVYPTQLFDVLNEIEAIHDYVLEVGSDVHLQDTLKLYIYTAMAAADCLDLIKPQFQHKWRVTPEIEFCSLAELHKKQFPDNSRKPIRFIDKRNNVF